MLTTWSAVHLAFAWLVPSIFAASGQLYGMSTEPGSVGLIAFGIVRSAAPVSAHGVLGAVSSVTVTPVTSV